MKFLISAFPGTGKSSIFKNKDRLGFVGSDELMVYDSDSSTFDKSKFPQNYISHISNVMNATPDTIMMVSSHDIVRAALKTAGIQYTLVYPSRELKDEYIKRYIHRGSPPEFIKMMDKNWDTFIDSCENDTAESVKLLGGEFLLDYIKLAFYKDMV